MQYSHAITAIFAAAQMLAATSIHAQSLVLRIDNVSGTLDWVDGHEITYTSGEANSTFGSMIDHEAQIGSPLLNYGGGGQHDGIGFDFSQDLTAIQGIGLFHVPPVTTWRGTIQGPVAPVFIHGSGSIGQFLALTEGTYTLPPNGPYSGGIEIQVVPEPKPMVLGVLSALGFLLFRNRKDVAH